MTSKFELHEWAVHGDELLERFPVESQKVF